MLCRNLIQMVPLTSIKFYPVVLRENADAELIQLQGDADKRKYGATFLIEKQALTDQAERQKQIELLKNSSMMSWQHVNLHGKYDFDMEVDTSPFDLTAIKSLNINLM